VECLSTALILGLSLGMKSRNEKLVSRSGETREQASLDFDMSIRPILAVDEAEGVQTGSLGGLELVWREANR
jgi:hypothetical protein